MWDMIMKLNTLNLDYITYSLKEKIQQEKCQSSRKDHLFLDAFSRDTMYRRIFTYTFEFATLARLVAVLSLQIVRFLGG